MFYEWDTIQDKQKLENKESIVKNQIIQAVEQHINHESSPNLHGYSHILSFTNHPWL
jgi:hypothetical protein